MAAVRSSGRGLVIGMAVCLLAAGVGVYQESPRDGAPPHQGASLGQPQAADAWNAEINELRASLLQIQTRLDQIAPRAAPGEGIYPNLAEGPQGRKAGERGPGRRGEGVKPATMGRVEKRPADENEGPGLPRPRRRPVAV